MLLYPILYCSLPSSNRAFVVVSNVKLFFTLLQLSSSSKLFVIVCNIIFLTSSHRVNSVYWYFSSYVEFISFVYPPQIELFDFVSNIKLIFILIKPRCLFVIVSIIICLFTPLNRTLCYCI